MNFDCAYKAWRAAEAAIEKCETDAEAYAAVDREAAALMAAFASPAPTTADIEQKLDMLESWLIVGLPDEDIDKARQMLTYIKADVARLEKLN